MLMGTTIVVKPEETSFATRHVIGYIMDDNVLQYHTQAPYSNFIDRYYKLYQINKRLEQTSNTELPCSGVCDVRWARIIRHEGKYPAWTCRWRTLHTQHVPVKSISFSTNKYGDAFSLQLITGFVGAVERMAVSKDHMKEEDFVRCIALMKNFIKIKYDIGTNNKDLEGYQYLELREAMNNLRRYIEICDLKRFSNV